MEATRVLVAAGNTAASVKLRNVLAESGFNVADIAVDGNDCLRKIRIQNPDLAVLDYDLPLLNGFEVAKIAAEDSLCDVILLVSHEKRISINTIEGSYDFTILTKPLSRDTLINTVNLMLRSRKKIMKLEKEIGELRMTLEARKDIDKAKGLLMKYMNMTEEQAFRRIQKQSMDLAKPMKEVAKSVISRYGRN